jgi:hypothetical protein
MVVQVLSVLPDMMSFLTGIISIYFDRLPWMLLGALMLINCVLVWTDFTRFKSPHVLLHKN